MLCPAFRSEVVVIVDAAHRLSICIRKLIDCQTMNPRNLILTTIFIYTPIYIYISV
jgi:hypothetical protein